MRLAHLLIFIAASCLFVDASYKGDSSNSEESSEESQEVAVEEGNKNNAMGQEDIDDVAEDGDDDMTDDCANRCVQQELRNNNLYTQNMDKACRSGCTSQASIVSDMKVKYPQTAPRLLLGAAVDDCWNSCLKEDPPQGQFCMTGCSAMKSIQIKKSSSEARQELDDSRSLDEELKKEILSYKTNAENEESKTGLKAQEDVNISGNIELASKNDNAAEDSEIAIKPIMRITLIRSTNFDDYINDYWSSVWRQLLQDVQSPEYPDMCGGQRDDNRQLAWPFPYSGPQAMTAEEDETSSLYVQVSSSLKDLRDNIEMATGSAGFHEHLFYFLLGLSGLLMLSSVINSAICPKRSESEDHFYLPPGEALPVKLPSYDECIKADMDMGIVEQEYKINLSLPVVAIATREDEEQTKEATCGEEAH